MRKFLSTKYSSFSFNLAMLLLRIGSGLLMMPHGYEKLVHFSEQKMNFINFLGLGSTISLALVIFAEFFCSLFIIIGLFTRAFTIPLIITMIVALFVTHGGDMFGKGSASAMFLTCYLVLLLCGPGNASVDGLMNKK